jgi:hypothetical protein
MCYFAKKTRRAQDTKNAMLTFVVPQTQMINDPRAIQKKSHVLAEEKTGE